MRAIRPVLAATVTATLVAGGAALAAPASAPAHGATAHHPVLMQAFQRVKGSLLPPPPPPPCPIPVTPIPSVPIPVLGGSTPSQLGPCVTVPAVPPAGQPDFGNMSYWGGRVQVHPHIYLVYFGWGQHGAFTDDCAPEKLVEGKVKATLKCDPDGAGKRMADFVYQLGGTHWAGIQTQYYQVVNGVQTNIANPVNQLSGIWVDDKDKNTAKITQRDMALEAERAVKHFKVAANDLMDSNFVIMQPQHFSDPAAQAGGYCAWHDNIQAYADQKDYHGLKPGVPFTNMPYILNMGGICGENIVNKGQSGKLDGLSIVLGHEIEETITDPGAEDVLQEGPIGGWYDALDGEENGDKCAWVGQDPFGGTYAIPGRVANITGNHGGVFPVQALWSNESAAGLGYCAGAGSDLPV